MKNLKNCAATAVVLAGLATACTSTQNPSVAQHSDSVSAYHATAPTVPATETPAAPISPCALISPQALTQAFDGTPVRGKSLSNGDCDYRTGSDSLTVTVDSETGKIRYQAARETYQSATTVHGIGDDAFVSPTDHRCSVLRGNTQTLLTLFTDETRFQKACVELMKAAAKNM